MGRLQQHDLAFRHSGQCGGQQPHFADTWLLNKQVDQCSFRPSATRQLQG